MIEGLQNLQNRKIRQFIHIAIFASGAGSNTQKIIDHFNLLQSTSGRKAEKVRIALIVCNNPKAGVLQIAEKEKIQILLIERHRFNKDGYLSELKKYKIEFIVLAGFLWKIPPEVIRAYPDKIINIHPALLPKFGGKNMYGHFVHEAVLNSGETESGITIHYVDELYDHGKIIFQSKCPIDKNETAESLAKKIHELEHANYPKIIEKITTMNTNNVAHMKDHQTKKYISAEEAVRIVESGNRVFIHGSAATPIHLINALQNRYQELKNVELVSITTLGNIDFNKPQYRKSFFFNSLFVSEATRSVVNSNDGDYVPVFLSEIPQLFMKNILPIDVAIVQVSAPDAHGYCSLGTSVDVARAAVDTAKYIIAQVNPLMPRTHGDGFIHLNKIDAVVWHEAALPEVDYSARCTQAVVDIGHHVASLVEDGATLQLGIGNIPDQVLKNLTNHKNLGLHTEMMSDGVIPLIQQGVINNKFKKLNIGRSVTSFMTGTRKLYDFVNDNPEIRVMDISYVNDTSIIRQNPKVTAVNSAIEIDLTGQVCADSIGTYQYSGIGGQMDFIRGASLSEGGKPIIALPSITSKGISRIVPFLKEGAGVVTTRGHVHWVVTEYGLTDLFGKSLKQRAHALIQIAHPDHREALEKAFYKRFG